MTWRRRTSQVAVQRPSNADELPGLDAEGVARSDLRGRLAVVFSPAGSGVELLLDALARLPDVTVRRDGNLFSKGLTQLYVDYAISAQPGMRDGIAQLAPGPTVLRALRELGDALFEPVTTRYVVDHSPADALIADVARLLYPDAGLVHFVRDGRTARTPATDWAATHRHLLALPPDVFAARVRYEDLVVDLPARIADLMAALGWAVDIPAYPVPSVVAHETPLSRQHLRDVERLGADLLREFGYAAPPRRLARSGRA
jgi:hypothetical protein